DFGAQPFRRRRKQPTPLRPRPRRAFRRQARRRDEGGARYAARWRGLVSPFELHAHGYRAGAQLGPRSNEARDVAERQTPHAVRQEGPYAGEPQSRDAYRKTTDQSRD